MDQCQLDHVEGLAKLSVHRVGETPEQRRTHQKLLCQPEVSASAIAAMVPSHMENSVVKDKHTTLMENHKNHIVTLPRLRTRDAI